MDLFKNIRFYVLLLTAAIAGSYYLWIKSTFPQGSIQIIKLTQGYALLALTYLYFAILATPLIKAFPALPLKNHYIFARRALGVSAFFFAALHAYNAFFRQLGGFGGLGFLSNKYLIAIILSTTALAILTTMASLSFDFMIARLGYARWKFIHRFVYLASLFVVIHALMLGSHFSDLSKLIPQIFFVALAFLLILEARRVDLNLQTRFPNLPKLGVTMVIALTAISAYSALSLLPANSAVSLGIHAQHIQLAKEAQKTANQPAASNPSLIGDRTKRFTVSFEHPSVIKPNEDTKLTFKVFDASSGNPVRLYSAFYEKLAHLIVVDNELGYFVHLHPEQKDNGFEITTRFLKEGRYHFYLDFQPLGAIEQQFAFTADIGTASPQPANFQPTNNPTIVAGTYEISLNHPVPLSASQMSVGNQRLTFTIKDTATKQPVTTLKPYLASFGHMVMINQETYDYLHIHPANLIAPQPDAHGGPTVEFIPIGLYSPIKPGTYRVFAQFNPDNQLITSDFTVKID